MKILKRNTLENINVILFCLLTAVIFWNRLATNIVLISWCVISILVYVNYLRKQKIPMLFYIIMAFIFLYIISWLITPYSKDAGGALKRSFYLILIPFCTFTFYSFNKSASKKYVWKSYLISNFLSSIFLIGNAIYRTYEYGSVNPFHITNGNFFSYLEFTNILKIHPVYYGLYTSISLGYITFLILNKKNNTVGLYLLILYFTTIIFLLNSFILVGGLILLILLSLHYIFKNRIYISTLKKTILALCILIPTLIASNFVIEKTKGVNLKEDFNVHDFQGDQFTAVRARVAKAYASFKLYRNNPIFGVGTGRAKTELLNTYKDINFTHGVEREYNSHNQYLTTMIQFGTVGLIFLLLILFFTGYQSIIKHEYLLFYFITLTMLVFCTESILERQNGAVFFSLMLGILCFNTTENNTI